MESASAGSSLGPRSDCCCDSWRAKRRSCSSCCSLVRTGAEESGF